MSQIRSKTAICDKFVAAKLNIMEKIEIECPYCHSNNTKKISELSRFSSISFFGLSSKKIGKQWHCNHCGSDF